MKVLLLMAMFLLTTYSPMLGKEKETPLEEINITEKVDPKIITTIANIPKPGEEILNKYRFKLGENIVFHAFHETWISRIHVGTCTMSVGKDLMHINNHWAIYFKLTAQSAKWYEKLYPIKDIVEGFFELDTNRTIFLRMDKQERSYFQTMDILFDYQKNIVFEKDFTKGKLKYRQYKLIKDTIDAYSTIFLIRRRDLKAINPIDYTVYSGGNTYDLGAEVVEERAKIKLYNKEFETIKVKLLTKITGAMEQRGGIFVYFLKDSLQTPIYIDANIKIGRIVLEADKATLPQ